MNAISPPPASRSLLQTVFKVQPGEGKRLGLMLLYSAAFGGGVITVGYRGVGSALFLSRLPASATPYLFILPAVAITLILLLYNRVAARVKTTPLILGSTSLMLVSCLLFRLLLETEYAGSFEVLAGIYLLTEAAMSVVGIQIWVVAGQVFNTREARRLFPLLASGGTIAGIAAGLSLGTLASLLGVNNLLVVVAFALGLCGVCAWALGRYQLAADTDGEAASRTRAVGRRAGRKVRGSGSFLQTVGALWRTPLLRAIGALTVLLALLINIGAYQFFRALQVSFSGQDGAMVTFLGAFEVWTGLSALLVQFLVAPYVIRRFGLLPALLFFPVATVLTSVGALAVGGVLLSIALIRSLDPVFRWTINDVATNLLYLPITAELRQRAKELFGVLYAVAFGLLGVIFLVTQTEGGWPYLYWSVPAVGLSLAWISLLPSARRQYLRKLTDNVSSHRFDLTGATLNITDPDAVRVLAATLRKDDELQVLHGLELINSAPGVNWDPYVTPLLAHPSSNVRLQALRYLGRPGNSGQAEAVAALFDAPDEAVCGAAIEAFCAIRGSDAVPRVGPFLEDKRPCVRGAAVLGLIRYGGPAVVVRAIAVLQEMAGNDSPAMRQEAGRVLGAVALPHLQTILLPLLDDPDPAVRLRAVQTARAMPVVELVPNLLRALGDRHVAQAAIEALASYGAIGLPGLRALLSNQAEDPAVRARVPRVLAKIGTAQAAEVVVAGLSEQDDLVQAALFKALADLAANGVESAVSEAELGEWIFYKLQACYKLYVMREDLEAGGPDPLLGEAVSLRLRRALRGVFDLLVVRYGSGRMQTVREALDATGTGKRAQAIELLDNLASSQVRDLLIPLIEAPAAQVLEIAQRKFSLARKPAPALLAELAVGPDTWLRACAIWRIGRSDVEGQYQRNEAMLGDEREMMLSIIERVLVLKRVPLFAGIPGEELAAIAQLAEEVRFSAGEIMIQQDEPGDCLYVTVDGQTGITISGVGQVAVRDAPTVLGEMAIILRQPRSAGCVALSDLLALRIDREPFQELLGQEPGVAVEVIKVLTERLGQAQQTAQDQDSGEG